MAKTKEQLQNILEQFQLADKVVSAEPFGNGHINDTLKVTNEKGEIKYVLQRINHLVFTNVDMLQNNIQIVTSHIRKKLEEKGESDIDRKVLTFFPTKDNKPYYFDGDSYWRVSLFIPNSKSYEEVTPELSYEAGKAFGDFQAMLADIPEGTLGETIPNFHNMEFRLAQFHDAIKANAAGRVSEVQDLIDEIERTFLQKHDIHLVIHYDPVVTDDAELTRMRGLVAEAVHGIDSRLQIHDFRMVRGPTHTNLIFDLVVPFDLMDRKAELKRRIDERVQFEDSRYYTVITFDEAFATPPPRE